MKGKSTRILKGLLAIGVVAAIVASGVYYYKTQLAKCRADALSRIAAIADMKVDELSLWRQERLADADMLYKNDAFSSLVRRCFDRPDDSTHQQELQSWIERMYASHLYDQIIVHHAGSGKFFSFPTPRRQYPRLPSKTLLKPSIPDN